MKKNYRWLAVTAAVIVGLVATPAAALAIVNGDSNVVLYHGPSSSYTEASWSGSTDTISSMETHPGGAFTTSPTHYCLAAVFDWGTDGFTPGESGHFDARVVRTCRSNTHLDKSFNDSGSVRSIVGMQRWGACYGPTGGVNTQHAYCTNDSRADLTAVRWDGVGPNTNLSDTNFCTAGHWAKYGVTYFSFYSGGSSTSCTS